MLSPVLSDPPVATASSLRVRPASEDDADFIVRLGASVFAAYGSSYDRYLRDWFSDPGVTTLVGEIDGRPRGFSMLAFYEDEDRPGTQVADLVSIAVEPEARGRGLGSALLDAAMEAAEERRPPVDAVWLVVADGNAHAARLFASRGFRYGEGVGIYPSGLRALRMIREVASDPQTREERER